MSKKHREQLSEILLDIDSIPEQDIDFGDEDYPYSPDDPPPFECDFYGADDEDEDEPTIEIPAIKVPSNKKARAIRSFACSIGGDYRVRVLEHKELLAYDRKSLCYVPVSDPRVFAERALRGKAWNLNQKDMGDIVQALFSDPDSQICADQVNADPVRINCRSGILNWKTGDVSEHSPNHLYSYCVDAEYLESDERGGCPAFEQFCATSLEGDAEKRQQLLEVIGYLLSDATGAKSAFFLHGAPDSGKSILLNFVSALLDRRLIVNIPLHRLGEKFMVAELMGRKINVAGEVKGSALRDISNFKSITGGDRVCGEYKGKAPFYFTPSCKLLFAGNTLPETTDTDMTKAFVNRLCIVIFGVSIPKDRQDKDLLEKLLAERHEIFSLAMDALRLLQRRNFQFTQPSDTRCFLNSYAETQSSVHAFIKDMCVIGEGGYVFSADLCAAYRKYCSQNGFDPMKNSAMQSMIATLPGISRDRIRAEGRNLRGFRGIYLRENMDGTLERCS